MTDIKTLRKILDTQKASWSIDPDIADTRSLNDFTQEQQLGSLPVTRSMPTTFMPRLHAAPDEPVVPAQPGVNRLLRRGTGGAGLPAAWDWRDVGG